LLVSGLHADAIKLMGGINLSKYSLSPKEQNIKWSYNPGFCIGAGIEFDLIPNGNIAFEVDGLMIQKKGSEMEDVVSPGLKTNYRLSLLCFPAMVRVKFKVESSIYLLGGANISLALSHKHSQQGDLTDLKEDTRKFDIGLVFGFGIKKKFNWYQDLFIEARCHFGFANILKETWKNQSLKTNAILIIFGIKNY